tara:strand:- start:2422 stop:2655 length:234 start_codon:yes stop_codon:yes gene_type:complete
MTAKKYKQTKNLNYAWLWALIFGLFYFMFNGAWKWCIIYTIVLIITLGWGGFIVAFFARSMMRQHLENTGWTIHRGE